MQVVLVQTVFKVAFKPPPKTTVTEEEVLSFGTVQEIVPFNVQTLLAEQTKDIVGLFEGNQLTTNGPGQITVQVDPLRAEPAGQE